MDLVKNNIEEEKSFLNIIYNIADRRVRYSNKYKYVHEWKDTYKADLDLIYKLIRDRINILEK